MGGDFFIAAGFWIGVAALIAATIGSLVFLQSRCLASRPVSACGFSLLSVSGARFGTRYEIRIAPQKRGDGHPDICARPSPDTGSLVIFSGAAPPHSFVRPGCSWIAPPCATLYGACWRILSGDPPEIDAVAVGLEAHLLAQGAAERRRRDFKQRLLNDVDHIADSVARMCHRS